MPAAAAETHSLTVSVRSVAGTPLSGITIVAISVADGRETDADLLPDGTYPKATAVSGKPGVYRFAALTDVDHTLYFATATSTSFAQLLGGASEISRAEVVPAAQETLSVSLATNAVITGTVKSASAKAMNKAYVSAFRYSGSEWERYSTARTDSHGKYTLTDIDPGSYRLKFEAYGGTYSPVYSGGGVSFDEAASYSVGVGTTTTVNAAFPKGTGTISGYAKVQYEDYEEYGSFGMAKAHAFAIPVKVSAEYPVTRTFAFDAAVASAATSKSGAYSIKNLRPGAYVVKVVPWYYNQSARYVGGDSLQTARIITVSSGKTSSKNNAYSYQSYEGGSLSVTSRKASNGAVISGADVLVQSDNDPDYFFSGKTDATGWVSFGVSGSHRTMQSGTYTVTITTDGAYAPYTTTKWVDASTNSVWASLAVPAKPAGFVAAPSIAETSLSVGTTYVVSAEAKRTTATLSYQWMRDGRPIWGADDAAYTSQDGDIATQLSVRVSSYQFGYPVDEAEAAVAGIVVSDESAPTVVTAPSITPKEEAHVGTTLRVLPGTWSVRGLSYSYQWYRDGVPFENEGDSYAVELADLDSEFTAVVTASKPGHPDASALTAAGVTPVFAAAVEPHSGVVVTSSTSSVPKGSLKFTVKPGTWTALSPTFAYEWWRSGVKVADGATYIEKQTSTYRAASLEVHVIAEAPGFGDGSAVAIARKASRALARTETPVATVGDETTPLASTSSIVYGGTVSVSTGTWAHGLDELGTVSYSYQWLRKVGSATTKSISGAKSSTYTPLVTDIGSKLSVTVTATSSVWSSASVTVAVGTVVGKDDLVTSITSITLTGPAVYNYDIGAPSVPAWTDAGAKVTYQWYSCARPSCTASSPMSKFTKVSYAKEKWWELNSPSIAGGRIFVTVTASKPGSRTARLSTPPITVAGLKQIVVIKKPTIYTSSPVVAGGYVGASWAEFANSYTTTRDWEVCFNDCLTPGATWASASGAKNTYYGTLVSDRSVWGDGHSYLRVVDTGTRPGYTTAVAYSDPVPFVPGSLSDYGTGYTGIQTVTADSWNVVFGATPLPAYVTMTAEWFVENESRGTGYSFTATTEDAGKLVFVVRTFTAVGFDDYQVVTRVRAGAPVLVTQTPVELLGGQFGDTMRVSDAFPWIVPVNDHAHWKVSYSWTIASWSRGSASTYTPYVGDVGSTASVSMTVSSPLYGAWTRQVYLGGALHAATIQPGAALDLDVPLTASWHGDLLPGTTLSSSTISYPVSGVTTAIQWQRSVDGSEWADIAGATSPDYTVGLIDSTQLLRVTVIASKAGHTTVVHRSDPVTVLEGNIIRVLGAPLISGEARVGSTLNTTIGAWTEGAVPHIQWLLNGRAIPGATGTTYVPLPTNAGDEISVRVTGSQSGKLDVVAETSAVTIAKGAAPTIRTAPVIIGTTTLSATPGVWTVSGLTFSYEWKLADAIVGMTDTLVLLPETTLADYTLTVRATRYGYEAGEYTTP
jgi:hypothetical protein